MVESYVTIVFCAVLTAGGFGCFMTHDLEKKENVPHKRALLIWGVSVPVFIGIAFWLKGYGYSSWKILRYLFILYALPVLAYIDGKDRKIPNRILGVLALLRCAILIGETMTYATLWKEVLFHTIAGGVGSFLLMMVAYYISRKAIGLGDVKLFTVMGFYLGFSLNYIVLFFSLIFAALYSVWSIFRKKLKAKDEIAFGPFVALGLWAALLLGF